MNATYDYKILEYKLWLGKLSKMIDVSKNRSSNLKLFYKKVVFFNFAKFIGKHLCQSLLRMLQEAQGL